MVATTKQSAGGPAEQVTLNAVLHEIREMRTEMRHVDRKLSEEVRTEMRDMRVLVEHVDSKVKTQLKEVRYDVAAVKDFADGVKRNVVHLTRDVAKSKVDLGAAFAGVRAKVDNVATKVNGTSAKFLGMGAKLDKLRADIVDVKVHGEDVGDGNADIKSSPRKMKMSTIDYGARVESALKAQGDEWREKKKLRLEHRTADHANDE